MNLLSFDPLRTLHLPNTVAVKPEHWFARKHEVLQADWVLFPEYWQVNALVYAWRKRIFPSISSYHLGHDKIEMTRAMQALGSHTMPATLILASTPAALEQIQDTFSYPMIAKSVRSSMGLGVFLLESPADLRRYAAQHEVLYLQEYLPIKRDLRVVWVGDQVVSAYWRVGREGDYRNNIAQGASADFTDIPAAALELVGRVARSLEINHAGFDVAEIDGEYRLFEFNVRFGTQSLRQQGIRLDDLIYAYLLRHTQPPLEPPRPWLPKAS